MTSKLLIFIGGSDAQNGDYSAVLRLVRRGGTANWSSLSTARPGDRVLIYIRQPPGALVVKAEILENPVKGKPGDYAYRAKIGKFELLPNQLEIGDLKCEFPRWDWLRFPRRGVTVPEKIAGRLWKLVHEKQSRVQILISNAGYGLRLLEKMHRSERAVYWSAPKLTQPGDTILFYVEEPVSAIVAVGKAMSGTRPTSSKWHEAKIGAIRKLEPPIGLKKFRQMFPDWAWLKHVNMFAYVSPGRAKALLKKCRQIEAARQTNGTTRRVGAGFGNAETNRLVEQAACGTVRERFEKRGYKVISREKENLGYDFDVTRNGEAIHVEVKGVSGSILKFPITANEIACARTDSKFRLAIVTEARTPRKKVHIFGRRDFLKGFGLTPLAYFAEAKENLRAR
jgi:hypothetical protein